MELIAITLVTLTGALSKVSPGFLNVNELFFRDGVRMPHICFLAAVQTVWLMHDYE